jgi:hypothetical protein
VDGNHLCGCCVQVVWRRQLRADGCPAGHSWTIHVCCACPGVRVVSRRSFKSNDIRDHEAVAVLCRAAAGRSLCDFVEGLTYSEESDRLQVRSMVVLSVPLCRCTFFAMR